MLIIVGGGISGLTLALSLHQIGIPCEVFEAAAEIKPLGVGINLLPHGVRELSELHLENQLASVAIATKELCYCNHFGQFFYKEPRGRFAGYDWPQFSVHRGELQQVLLTAAQERLGHERINVGHKCVSIAQDTEGVTVHFVDAQGKPLPPKHATGVIGCDGIDSAVRKYMHPDEGRLSYEGINMWRGLTRRKPFLTGASMVLAGWYDVGMMVIYPIRDNVDEDGNQLINWVAQIQSNRREMQNWNLTGRLDDFYPAFANWQFDWLDIASLIREADTILEFPMVDREPIPQWSTGRVTLVGDAAHPMYPRGGTGAGQAILDARTLAGCLKRQPDLVSAFKAYEDARLEAANAVVLTNRNSASDALLRVVRERGGDKPFDRVEDIIDGEELAKMSENYKRVAGFEREALRNRPSLV